MIVQLWEGLYKKRQSIFHKLILFLYKTTREENQRDSMSTVCLPNKALKTCDVSVEGTEAEISVIGKLESFTAYERNSQEVWLDK